METKRNFSKIESIKPKEVISFEDLDLYLDDSEWDFEKSHKIKVNFNGVELTLKRKKMNHDNDDYSWFSFELSKDDALVKIDVDIFEGMAENNSSLIETCIIRKDVLKGSGERVLPNGLGAVVYKKMLEFFQSLANHNKKEYQHLVLRVPEVSKEKKTLSKERWEQIFLPLLNKGDRQYEYIERYLEGDEEDGDYYEAYKYTYRPKKVIKKEAA